jgi:hypothetical protein
MTQKQQTVQDKFSQDVVQEQLKTGPVPTDEAWEGWPAIEE